MNISNKQNLSVHIKQLYLITSIRTHYSGYVRGKDIIIKE